MPSSTNAATRKFKIGLNAYSFNNMLMNKKMTQAGLLEFCAATGFDAVDMTGYYFSSYPDTPTDDEIFAFKRKAHALGIEISGTGVRNDFTAADPGAMDKEIDLVKKWIIVAAKLGAPVLRIFAGKIYAEGEERKIVKARIIHAIDQCLPLAKTHGIILGVQNHNDFLRTSDECFDLIAPFKSPWLGLILDTGNFIAADPYEEIRKAIPLAVNWQVKEKLLINGKQAPMDLPRLTGIIKASDYNGNIPIETLGPEDPLIQVPLYFKEVSKYLLD
ncbi:MAG TPA: sugar phosphate isomerase/epimerase family protein [Chitinophagaceae bacterium]|nr:sugar phosphate isomerase/epimerase family protein [Chitinophagaceae bacterium]